MFRHLDNHMTCGEFLQGLSDFRDGLVRDEVLLARFESHRRECRRCARMLAALDLGLHTLRTPEDDGPSLGFRDGLERRLRAEVALGDPVMPTHAGLAAAFLMLAAAALVVYEGVARRAGSPVAARSTIPAVFPSLPAAFPVMEDVTLSPFTPSAFEYHGQRIPLGTFATLTD